MTDQDYVNQALATGEVSQQEISSFIANNPGDYARIWSAFDLDSEGGLRAIAGAPGSPASYGTGPQPSFSWSIGGDMGTMSLDGTLSGDQSVAALPVAGASGSGVGAARVDESMGSRMQTAIALPGGGTDWGKIVMIIGVVVTLYVIGREMGRKGPVQ